MLNSKFVKIPDELIHKIQPLNYVALMTKEWKQLKSFNPNLEKTLQEYLEEVPP
jgi:predicted transcriptional regulator